MTRQEALILVLDALRLSGMSSRIAAEAIHTLGIKADEIEAAYAEAKK